MSVISGGSRRAGPLSSPATLCACSSRNAQGKSLWPSISGVRLRIRSIRALVSVSIGWAGAGAASIARHRPARRGVTDFMTTGLEKWARGANGLASAAAAGDGKDMDQSTARDLEEVMQFDPEEGI